MEHAVAWRAEWLARLAEAIEGAQRLAWQLRTDESSSLEARELYGRLESARIELESLRGLTSRPNDPLPADWLKDLGWIGSLLDPAD
jgi:hypothetical protein